MIPESPELTRRKYGRFCSPKPDVKREIMIEKGIYDGNE